MSAVNVAGLRSPDVTFDAADRAELLVIADESLDRIDRPVSRR